jgi:hypothetical protein
MIISGEGKYKVFLEEKKIDEDLIYILRGGERSHIGGVVICEPSKKSHILRLEGHYDDIVLKPIAEAACKKYKKRVAAIGGVHVDNASDMEINILVKNCKDLIKCI